VESEHGRVVRAPVERRVNFLNEGCEYLDLELDEAYPSGDELASNSESIPIHVNAINGSK